MSVDQTIDDDGKAIDCGIQCDQFCCRPGQTTKYLLPGERRFLTEALEARGDDEAAFKLTSLGFFDSIVEPLDRACACQPLRELRTFNCRVFPYSPVIDVDKRAVTGLKKGTHSYLKSCWITQPAPAYTKNAVAAWQRVLDDDDNRALYARLSAMWEWHKATERGEEPGHVLTVLVELDHCTPDELWPRAARFFSRTE